MDVVHMILDFHHVSFIAFNAVLDAVHEAGTIRHTMAIVAVADSWYADIISVHNITGGVTLNAMVGIDSALVKSGFMTKVAPTIGVVNW